MRRAFIDRTSAIGLSIFFGSLLFFLINIQNPPRWNFDESHYVPAAKAIFQAKDNNNMEHPPLAKFLVGSGITLWGDNPLGWRFMSTVFGSLALVGIFFWSWSLFRDEGLAIWSALICLFNQIHYVESRIATLDVFACALLIWAAAAFTASWNPRISPSDTKKNLILLGFMLGFGAACKWLGLFLWAGCFFLIGFVRLLQGWKVQFGDSKGSDWYHPKLWQHVSVRYWLLYLGLLPIAVYSLSFVPLFFSQRYSHFEPYQIILWQQEMWSRLTQNLPAHNYNSNWVDWVLNRRPVWYYFEADTRPGFVRNVILLGNPLVMWSGLAAVLYGIWMWIREREKEAFLAICFYWIFLLSWILAPRKTGLYYNYYLSAMCLSLALGYFFFRFERGRPKFKKFKWIYLCLVFLVFAYFFPVISAMSIPQDLFHSRMWLKSWY